MYEDREAWPFFVFLVIFGGKLNICFAEPFLTDRDAGILVMHVSSKSAVSQPFPRAHRNIAPRGSVLGCGVTCHRTAWYILAKRPLPENADQDGFPMPRTRST